MNNATKIAIYALLMLLVAMVIATAYFTDKQYEAMRATSVEPPTQLIRIHNEGVEVLSISCTTGEVRLRGKVIGQDDSLIKACDVEL